MYYLAIFFQNSQEFTYYIPGKGKMEISSDQYHNVIAVFFQQRPELIKEKKIEQVV
jgi:hypothetical protein